MLCTAAHVLSREWPAAAKAERVLAEQLLLEVLLLAVDWQALCLRSCGLRRIASLLWPACKEWTCQQWCCAGELPNLIPHVLSTTAGHCLSGEVGSNELDKTCSSIGYRHPSAVRIMQMCAGKETDTDSCWLLHIERWPPGRPQIQSPLVHGGFQVVAGGH